MRRAPWSFPLAVVLWFRVLRELVSLALLLFALAVAFHFVVRPLL